MRNSPWLQQRRSESAPPVDRVKEAPTISQKQQDESMERISRPTESALYRQSLFWKLDGFMDRGFHSWSKMKLFEDCKRCMWAKDGNIKSSCKIRPLETSGSYNSLPPLSTTPTPLQSSQRPRLRPPSQRGLDAVSTTCDTSRTSREGSFITPRPTTRTARESVCGKSSSFHVGNNRTAFANGLSALGGMSGLRYKHRPNPLLSIR